MYRTITILSLLALVGCAATYQAPEAKQQSYDYQIGRSKEDIFNVALRALAEDGYSISLSDRTSGMIVTNRIARRLSSSDCDCGTTMGIPYIKDNKTTTDITVSVFAKDNAFTIKASIYGEYLPNDSIQGKTFDCVSLGTIEKRIAKKVLDLLQ